MDVYVSNYRLQPNLLWRNDGNGAFSEEAGKLGAVGTSPGFKGGHSIGAAWGDFDNDGLVDLFAGNFAHVDARGDQPKSRFLRNLGEEKGYAFEDLGPRGVHYQESYASPAAADYDNDGNLDLFFTTVYAGAPFGRKNNPVLFRNDGRIKVTDLSGSVLLQAVGAELIASGAYDRHLEVVVTENRERMRRLCEGLASELPEGCAVTAPRGGHALWVREVAFR